MVKKKVEQLIKIIGKGNLLEALFIFLGAFQHASLNDEVERIDHRNHYDLLIFIKKSKEPLDKYFSLKLSLQGLFLIYAKAYKILNENNKLCTQDVIDKIHEIIKKSNLEKYEYNEKSKLDLLNILANPLGKLAFNVEKDFEDKVVVEVKNLLKNANTISNKYDREFVLGKCVIDCFYFIHQDIKLDKSIVLLLSMWIDYHKLSDCNKKVIKKETLPIVVDNTLSSYIMQLANILQNIGLLNENGNKYVLNYEGIIRKESTFKERALNEDFMYLKSIELTLKRLLQNQDSNEFEKIVLNPKNIHYLPPQGGNKCVLNNFHKKEGKYTKHKHITCKLILGTFVLPVGLCSIGYLFMLQKLPQVIKNFLPQDNLINLVIFTVLTIIIAPVLFQLYKLQTSKHAINDISISENLENTKLAIFS